MLFLSVLRYTRSISNYALEPTCYQNNFVRCGRGSIKLPAPSQFLQYPHHRHHEAPRRQNRRSQSGTSLRCISHGYIHGMYRSALLGIFTAAIPQLLKSSVAKQHYFRFNLFKRDKIFDGIFKPSFSTRYPAIYAPSFNVVTLQ